MSESNPESTDTCGIVFTDICGCFTTNEKVLSEASFSKSMAGEGS